MVKVKDAVMDLARERPFISIEILEKELGLPEDKACQILLLLSGRREILPLAEAFFAIPREGRVVRLRKKWDTGKAREILADMESGELPEALSVNDLVAARVDKDQMSNQTARAVLNALVGESKLIKATATAGGSYGRRPIIYGLNEEAILQRNQQFVEKDLEKKRSKGDRAPSDKYEPTESVTDLVTGTTSPVPKRPVKETHHGLYDTPPPGWDE